MANLLWLCLACVQRLPKKNSSAQQNSSALLKHLNAPSQSQNSVPARRECSKSFRLPTRLLTATALVMRASVPSQRGPQRPPTPTVVSNSSALLATVLETCSPAKKPSAPPHRLLQDVPTMVQGVKIEQGHIVDTNPATGAVIQRVRVSTPSEIDAAVAAARTAQPSWNARSLHERTELVKKACAALAGKRQQLAKLITSEMGKTLAESLEEVGVGVEPTFCYAIDATCPMASYERARRIDDNIDVRHPHGVVAVAQPELSR